MSVIWILALSKVQWTAVLAMIVGLTLFGLSLVCHTPSK